MDSEKYTLQELVNTYLRYVSSGLLDLSRWEVHKAILAKLNITEEQLEELLAVNKILHNLDREVGLCVDVDYDENDFHKMSKRIIGKLKIIKGGKINEKIGIYKV